MKRKCKLISFLLLISFSGSALSADTSGASAEKSEKREGNGFEIHKHWTDDRNYSWVVLPNGLQVVLVSDPSTSSAAVAMSVGAGSVNDIPGRLGLAHYVEHLVQSGSNSHSEKNDFMHFVTSLRGSTNAFTSSFETTYFFQIPNMNLSEALYRFGKQFDQLKVENDTSGNEVHAINAEWSSLRDNNFHVLEMINRMTIRQSHPMARMYIGNSETLADKNGSRPLSDAMSFYERYYHAKNMKLTILGNQSLQQLKFYAEEYFSEIKNSEVDRIEINENAFSSDILGKEIHFKPLTKMRALFVDFPLQSNISDSAAYCIADLMQSKNSGALYDWLMSKRLVQNVVVQARPRHFGNDGFLRISYDLTKKGLKESDTVIAATYTYLKSIKLKSINQQCSDFLMANEAKVFASTASLSSVDLVKKISSQQLKYPVEHVLDGGSKPVTFDNVSIASTVDAWNMEFARIWYINENEAVGRVIPYYLINYQFTDISSKKIQHWRKLASEMNFRVPDLSSSLTTSKNNLDETFYEPPITFQSDGLEAYFVSSSKGDPNHGTIDVELNTALNYKNAKNYVLSSLLKMIFNKKLESLRDFAEKQGLKLSVDSSGSRESLMLHTSGEVTEQLNFLIKSLQELRDLKVTPLEFEESIDELQALTSFHTLPVAKQLENQLYRVAFRVPVDNANYHKSLNNITLEEFRKFQREIINSTTIRVLYYGDFNELDLSQASTRLRKMLPITFEGAHREAWDFYKAKPSRSTSIKTDTQLNNCGLFDTYMVSNAQPGERASIAILQSLIRQRFFDEIRSKKQFGYVADVRLISAGNSEILGFLVESADKSLPTLHQGIVDFKRDFFSELKSLSSSELDRLKLQLGHRTEKPLDEYRRKFQNGFTPAQESNVRDFRNVSKEDLIQLYERLLLKGESENILFQMRGKGCIEQPFVKSK